MDMLWWRLAVDHAQFWRGCITFLLFTGLEKVRYTLLFLQNTAGHNHLIFFHSKKRFFVFIH